VSDLELTVDADPVAAIRERCRQIALQVDDLVRTLACERRTATRREAAMMYAFRRELEALHDRHRELQAPPP